MRKFNENFYTTYKNFIITHKKNFNINRFKKFGIIKGCRVNKYFREYDIFNSKLKFKKLIVITLKSPTHKLNNIVTDLGKKYDWDIIKYILEVFPFKNKYEFYLDDWLNFLLKNIDNKNFNQKYIFDPNYGKIVRYKNIIKNIVGHSVLDVGTSIGFLPLLIKIKYNYFDVTASDINNIDFIRKFVEKKNIDIRVIKLDITNREDCQREKYDTVVFSHVLEHLSKKTNEIVFKNLMKLAKKRIIVVVPFEKVIENVGHLQRFDVKKILQISNKFCFGCSIKFLDSLLIIDKK